MTGKGPWCIGLLLDPCPGDKLKYIHDFGDAVRKAIHRSECDEKQIVAIWDIEDEPVRIYVGGYTWERSGCYDLL